MTAILGQHLLENKRDDKEVVMGFESYVVIEVQHKGSWSHTDAHEKGGEFGTTIGTELSYKGGTPFASAEGKDKVEFSGKYIQKDVRMSLNSEEDTTAKRVSGL